MVKATLRSLLAHKLRLALTALAIVLGVSLIAGTLVLSDTLNGTFQTLFSTANAGVSVQVAGPPLATADQNGFSRYDTVPQSVVATIRGVPGVRAAYGSVVSDGNVVLDRQGKAPNIQGPPQLGTNWIPDSHLSPYHLRSGRAPQAPDEVVIDANTVNKDGYHLGDTVHILPAGGASQPFTLVGISAFGSSDSLAGATVVAWDTPTAQRLLDKPGRFDIVYVAGDGSATDLVLRNRIAAALPADLTVQTKADAQAEEQSQVTQQLSFFTYFLTGFGVIAVFVGAFIILNTFNILVAQRTRELALLRCLGATRAQVRRMVLLEAFITGVIASLLGAALGLLIARGLFGLFNALGSQLPSQGLTVHAGSLLVAIAVGVVVTVAAAVFPARRATRVAPIAALREHDPSVERIGVRRTVTGAVVTALGLTSLLVGLFASFGSRLWEVLAGAFVIFVGVAIVAPVFVRPVAAAIGLPVRRLRGVSGMLAVENSVRNPKRTALSSAALMIGLALVTFFAVIASSAEASASAALDSGVRADYFAINQTTGVFSPQVAARLQQDSRLTDVTEIRIGNFLLNGSRQSLQAVQPDHLERVLGFVIVSGQVRLDPGDVLVSDTAAKAHDLHVGSPVHMRFAHSAATFTVSGTYQANGILGDYTIALAGFIPNFTADQQLDAVVLANAAPGVSHDAGLHAMQSDLAAFPTVTVDDQAAFKQQIHDQLQQPLAIINVLLLLAIIIATLGIVNTLALSITERYRELGLLRALGMTRSQVRVMVRWESVIIALLGAVLGIVVGVFLGWALVRALRDQGFAAFSLPGGSLAGYFVTAAIFGVIAAIFPARRAARLNVLEAIAAE